ncbi:MAG: ATP-binding cassette domain-containing protein, partial [Pseudomonadota bacterium]
MTTRAPVLRLRGLRKTLGHPGGPERFELRVDRLDLAPGRLVAVIGPSGAGKSTLLDILALISAPDAAEAFSVATLADESDAAALWTAGDERGLSLLRRHVGLVLQSGGLAPFLDVAGNAAAARRLAGLPADPALIEALAEELELGRRLRARPATLSGGERQRAAILSALAREPKLLVADEPTAAVDRARGRAIVEALAAQVARRGAAGVLVSHDLELVGQVADEVYRMELSVSADGATVATCAPVADGAVAASGPTDQGARVPTAGPKAPSPRRRASGGGPFFPARLALLDLWRDARFTTAAVAGLAAVIAPLLVLLGLQIGVVAHEVERLTEDPRNRELTPLRAGLVTEARLDAWRAREDVAFVTPSIARGASAAAV